MSPRRHHASLPASRVDPGGNGPHRAVLRRAWSLEASWHDPRMQGLGVLYALLPVLRRAVEPREALRRHAGYFNMNAWMAPTLLGSVARLEGEGRGDLAARLREQMAGPLSGAGDLFVWGALRPAALALGITGALVGRPLWGWGAALALYLLPLAVLFVRGFGNGFAAGDKLPQHLEVLQPSGRAVRRLRQGLALWGGALMAWNVASASRVSSREIFPIGLALVLGYYAARRQSSSAGTFLILTALLTAAHILGFSRLR